MVFKINKYSPDYTAFLGKNLTSMGPIEKYTTEVLNSDNSDIRIFPNPANDYFTFEISDLNIKSFEIINIFGEILIFSDNITNNKITYSTELFQTGIYFINLHYADKTSSRKLLINK